MKRIASTVIFLLLISLMLSSCSAGLTVPEDPRPTETEVKKEENTETEEGEEKPSILQEYDPREDDVLNILMIGNSYCYY